MHPIIVPLLNFQKEKMIRNVSKTPYFIFLLVLVTVEVQGRYLPERATELVSDGVHNNLQHNETSYLVLKGIDDESFEEPCKQMYGFLPCTNNIFGHLFLILVYEYLLFHGSENHIWLKGLSKSSRFLVPVSLVPFQSP